MFRFMLNTNICIYVMKRKPLELLEKFNEHSKELAISTIVLGELFLGAEKSLHIEANRREITRFVSRMEVLSFDPSAATHYGDIRAHLERAGTPIGANDTLIGAHARSLGMTLVTNNRREFDRIPGLIVENWV